MKFFDDFLKTRRSLVLENNVFNESRGKRQFRKKREIFLINWKNFRRKKYIFLQKIFAINNSRNSLILLSVDTNDILKNLLTFKGMQIPRQKVRFYDTMLIYRFNEIFNSLIFCAYFLLFS